MYGVSQLYTLALLLRFAAAPHTSSVVVGAEPIYIERVVSPYIHHIISYPILSYHGVLAEQVGRIRMACDEVDHLDGLCGNAQQRVQVRMRAAALVQQQLAQRAAVEAAGPTGREKGQNVIHTYITTNIYYLIYITYIQYIIHTYIHRTYKHEDIQ